VASGSAWRIVCSCAGLRRAGLPPSCTAAGSQPVGESILPLPVAPPARGQGSFLCATFLPPSSVALWVPRARGPWLFELSSVCVVFPPPAAQTSFDGSNGTALHTTNKQRSNKDDSRRDSAGDGRTAERGEQHDGQSGQQHSTERTAHRTAGDAPSFPHSWPCLQPLFAPLLPSFAPSPAVAAGTTTAPRIRGSDRTRPSPSQRKRKFETALNLA
jgi:hypothetical protein